MKNPLRLKAREACGCPACRADYASEYLCPRGERIATALRETVVQAVETAQAFGHNGVPYIIASKLIDRFDPDNATLATA